MSVHTKVRIEGEGCVQEVPAEVVHLVSGPYYGQDTAQFFRHIELLAAVAGTKGIARFIMTTDAESEIVEKTLGLTEPTTEEEFDAWDEKRSMGMDTLGPWYPVAEGLAELDALLEALNADSAVVRSMHDDIREMIKNDLLSFRLILASPGMASKRFRLSVN